MHRYLSADNSIDFGSKHGDGKKKIFIPGSQHQEHPIPKLSNIRFVGRKSSVIVALGDPTRRFGRYGNNIQELRHDQGGNRNSDHRPHRPAKRPGCGNNQKQNSQHAAYEQYDIHCSPSSRRICFNRLPFIKSNRRLVPLNTNSEVRPIQRGDVGPRDPALSGCCKAEGRHAGSWTLIRHVKELQLPAKVTKVQGERGPDA